jgi:hypothetical protein
MEAWSQAQAPAGSGVTNMPDLSSTMPAIGETIELPATVSTLSGEIIPSLSRSSRTIYLVTSTGCAACQRELPTFGDLLLLAESKGFATRMLVLPGAPADDDWFLARVPQSANVVLDSAEIAKTILRTRGTPSVVIMDEDGVVAGIYSPSREWPITAALLDQLGHK